MNRLRERLALAAGASWLEASWLQFSLSLPALSTSAMREGRSIPSFALASAPSPSYDEESFTKALSRSSSATDSTSPAAGTLGEPSTSATLLGLSCSARADAGNPALPPAP